MAANTPLARPRIVESYVREAVQLLSERRKLLGQRIREARLEKRWKQKHLAAAVYVEPMTVSRWERGTHSPDLDKLELIAEATDKDLAFFFPDDEATTERTAIGEQLAEIIARLDRIEKRLP